MRFYWNTRNRENMASKATMCQAVLRASAKVGTIGFNDDGDSDQGDDHHHQPPPAASCLLFAANGGSNSSAHLVVLNNGEKARACALYAS